MFNILRNDVTDPTPHPHAPLPLCFCLSVSPSSPVWFSNLLATAPSNMGTLKINHDSLSYISPITKSNEEKKNVYACRPSAHLLRRNKYLFKSFPQSQLCCLPFYCGLLRVSFPYSYQICGVPVFLSFCLVPWHFPGGNCCCTNL